MVEIVLYRPQAIYMSWTMQEPYDQPLPAIHDENLSRKRGRETLFLSYIHSVQYQETKLPTWLVIDKPFRIKLVQ